MSRYCHTSSSCRRAFTLLEVMLVMAILVTVAAVSWPQIHRAYESVRLRKAADQVQAGLAHARVEAMSSGLTQIFRFEPNSPRYTITPYQDDSVSSLDSTAVDASGSSAGQVASSPSSAAGSPTGGQTDPSNPCEHQLPDGFVFSTAQRSSDSRTAATEGQMNDTSASADAPPVFFYPNGESQDAIITISMDNGRSISITLRGYTGVTHVGEIFFGEGAQK
jgi:prepilin-type N-terminal cleavage/methylation domain-containing protein